MSLEKLIGFTTSIGVATRESGEVIGNSLKAIISRVNTLDKARTALEGLGIATKTLAGDNRDVSDILDDLAVKWTSLNNAQKQNTAIAVAGTYQLGRFVSLMNNYQMGLDAANTAQRSYNSAVKENERFMASLTAKLNLMKASFQTFTNALANAGADKAIGVLLLGINNMMQGFTKLINIMGKWTFAVPVAIGAITAFALAFQRTKQEMLAFQLASLSMNSNFGRMAFQMTSTVTTTSILGGAFASLRTAALGLTTALLTNPLTWITVALTAIPMVIGYYQRLKAEHDALMKKAEDNTQAFKDFKKEIESGNVNETSLDVFSSKAEVAEKTLGKLKKANEAYIKIQQEQAKAQGAVNSRYYESTGSMKVYGNWQDQLSKKVKEELADIGIKYDKYDSFKDLMAAVTARQHEYTNSVADGQEVLKNAEKQLMFNADAFDEVGEEIKDTMTTMELFFGYTDKMTQELTGSYNTIKVLTKAKSLNSAQQEALNNAIDAGTRATGLSREELLKHPEAMAEIINYQQKMQDKWGEATEKILTDEQAKQLAVDVTTSNTKIASVEQIKAEKAAAEEKARLAQEEAEKKAKAYSKIRGEMLFAKEAGYDWTQEDTKQALERAIGQQNASQNITDVFKTEKKKADELKQTHEYLAKITGSTGIQRKTSTQQAADSAWNSLMKEQQAATNTKNGWADLAGQASSANRTVSSTTNTSATNTTTYLSGAQRKINELKGTWEALKQVFKNPITGIINIVQKMLGIKNDKGQGGGTKNIPHSSGGMGGPLITSGYGYRIDPFTGTKAFHHGVDIAGSTGQAVRSNVSGQVVFSGYGTSGSPLAGLGNVVAIRDSAGLTHIYGHNQDNYARVGSVVQSGQAIAAMGSTGRSTGTHSHYEVRAGGRSVNPLAMGGQYTVKKGDTFSEIAQKYYGNAYSGGMTKLKALNPKIKDINKIYTGQVITVPDAAKSTTTSATKTTTTPAVVTSPTADQARDTWNNATGLIDYRKTVGVYNTNEALLSTIQQRTSAGIAGENEKEDYNKRILDLLGTYSDLNEVRTKFSQANLFGSASDQTKMLNQLLIEVKNNALDQLQNSTTTWLDTFTEGLTEANQKVQDILSTNESIKSQLEDMAKSKFVDSYVNEGLELVGIGEKKTNEEKIQDKLSAIEKEVEERLTQNAEISWYLDPQAVASRGKELQGEISKIQAQMNQTVAQATKSELNSTQYTEVMKPLTEQYEALLQEYNELNAAVDSNSQIYNSNQSAVDSLSEEYKQLQQELTETQRRTEMLTTIKDKVNDLFNWNSDSLWAEKTDEFGNTVRDIEGAIRSVLDVQKAIQDITSNIYENIDNTVQEMITEILTSELPDLGSMFDAESDYSGIANGINGAIGTIKPTWDEALNYMSSSMANMFSSQNWQDTMEDWVDGMATATEGLQPLFESMMMRFPEVIGNIMSELPSLVSTAMQNMTVGVFNTVVETLNRLVATVNQIVPADQRVPMFDQMQYATPTYTQNNETSTEQKVYQAGNVEKNVTYIINTGVAIASESELREFAMLLKEMMDEEEGRGN